MSHSAEDIQAHVRTYIKIFVALLVLTGVTVAISYLHLPVGPAVILALAVATLKGSLVAIFFMHLKGEKAWVTWSLALTAFFFMLLFALPKWTESDHIVGTAPDAWAAGDANPVVPEHSPAPAH